MNDTDDDAYAGIPVHLRPIEAEIVNELCDRAVQVDSSYHVMLEARGFKESRSPWDCLRLARALAIDYGGTPIVMDLFKLAQQRAGLKPDIPA